MAQYFQRARLEYDLDDRRVRRTPLGEALEKQQPPVPPAPGIRYFPETGHNVGGGFLRFFVENGGAPALGYPISEEVVKTDTPPSGSSTCGWSGGRSTRPGGRWCTD